MPAVSPRSNYRKLLLSPYSDTSPPSHRLLTIIFTSAVMTTEQDKHLFGAGQKRHGWKMNAACQQCSSFWHCQLLQLCLLATQRRLHPARIRPQPSTASSRGRVRTCATGVLQQVELPLPTVTGGLVGASNAKKNDALYTQLARHRQPHRGQPARTVVNWKSPGAADQSQI